MTDINTIPDEIESAINDFEHTSIGPDAFDPGNEQIYFDELRERIYDYFSYEIDPEINDKNRHAIERNKIAQFKLAQIIGRFIADLTPGIFHAYPELSDVFPLSDYFENGDVPTEKYYQLAGIIADVFEYELREIYHYTAFYAGRYRLPKS